MTLTGTECQASTMLSIDRPRAAVHDSAFSGRASADMHSRLVKTVSGCGDFHGAKVGRPSELTSGAWARLAGEANVHSIA